LGKKKKNKLHRGRSKGPRARKTGKRWEINDKIALVPLESGGGHSEVRGGGGQKIGELRKVNHRCNVEKVRDKGVRGGKNRRMKV